jgi:hypothetical protein
MNSSRLSARILTAVIGLACLSGCSQEVNHTIEGGIKNALPKAIGPAATYAVTVESDPFELARGHLRQVKIVGTDVNLSPQLLIDELDVDATDIDADIVTQKVTSIGNVVFRAVVGQDSINHYLDSQSTNSPQRLEHLTVDLNDHSVTATVLVRALGVYVPASVTGTFGVEPGSRKYIDFIADSGSLSIIPVPQFALRYALNRINPVIDLTTSTVPVTVENVSIVGGDLIITGEADLQQGLSQNT